MRKRIATIGFFDGVHLGHICLINQLKKWAQEVDGEYVVLTMWPHPQAIVGTTSCPPLLTTKEEKLQLLRQAGVDSVEVLAFDKAMSQMPAREFMEKTLRNKLQIHGLLMGYDHRFGHGGGTLQAFAQWGREVGLEVRYAQPLQGMKASSSAIRQALSLGHIDDANAMLGRPYQLGGTVEGGYRVGRTMGFPTANMKPWKDKLMPADGVYAVWAVLANGARHKGVLNIGARPTLGGGTTTVEVHLLDYEGDLYGQTLCIQLVQRLRDEAKFASLAQLQAQIGRDAAKAEQLLS